MYNYEFIYEICECVSLSVDERGVHLWICEWI